MTGIPQLVRTLNGARVSALSLGLPVGADYLAFVGARARLNTWLVGHQRDVDRENKPDVDCSPKGERHGRQVSC